MSCLRHRQPLKCENFTLQLAIAMWLITSRPYQRNGVCSLKNQVPPQEKWSYSQSQSEQHQYLISEEVLAEVKQDVTEDGTLSPTNYVPPLLFSFSSSVCFSCSMSLFSLVFSTISFFSSLTVACTSVQTECSCQTFIGSNMYHFVSSYSLFPSPTLALNRFSG